VTPDDGVPSEAGGESGQLPDAPAGKAPSASDGAVGSSPATDGSPAIDAPQAIDAPLGDPDAGPSDASDPFRLWLGDGALNDAPGACTGPYPPLGDTCHSGRALAVCLPPSGGGETTWINNTVSLEPAADSGEDDASPELAEERCVNACAPDEYAAWCSLLGEGGVKTLDRYLMNGCRAPEGRAFDVSSSVYLCCRCPG
jgi:hypothetical protein